jgi:hypothetical protein
VWLALFLNLVPVLKDGMAHSADAADQAKSFTVESPRAPSEAVLLLIQRYGYVITYEDAPLAYSGDLQDLTSERHADLSYLKKPGAVREIVPHSETLTVNLPAPRDMSDPSNMAAVLEQMLETHEMSHQGGRFRLQQTEGVFHIVPTDVRDSHGKWVAHESILEAKISVAKLEGPVAILLVTICAAVSDATRTHVVLGHVPMDAPADYRGVLAANDEPARSVLLRMLNGTHRRLSWLLEYDAGMPEYIPGIILVPDRAGVAAPAARRRAHRQPWGYRRIQDDDRSRAEAVGYGVEGPRSRTVLGRITLIHFGAAGGAQELC